MTKIGLIDNKKDNSQSFKKFVKQPAGQGRWGRLSALAYRRRLLIRLGMLLLVATGLYLFFANQSTPATLAQDPGVTGADVYSEAECIQCHVERQAESIAQSGLTAQEGLTTSSIPIVSTHSNKDFAGTQEDFEFGCTDCHAFVHGGGSNIKLIGEYVVVSPTAMIKTGPVTFTARTGLNSYDDGSSPSTSRICVTCHINSNRSGAVTTMTHTGGISHTGGGDYTGQTCTACHPHNLDETSSTQDGFMPGGGCTECHAKVQDLSGIGPTGGRRAVVLEFGALTGTTNIASHHVISATGPITAGAVTDNDCKQCHLEPNNHADGYLQMKNADTSEVYTEPTPGAFRPENITITDSKTLALFCLSCHDSDGANGDTTPFSDGVTVPNINNAAWYSSAHDSGGTTNSGYGCLGNGTTGGCHATAHGSESAKILADPAVGAAAIDQLCYNCHTDGMVINNALSNRVGYISADDIEEAFGKSTAHPVGANFTINGNTYTLQCTSCHNPHVVSGKYWDAGNDKTPITRPDLTASPAANPRAMSTNLWGDAAGEKMADYAGSGTYRTPNNDVFTGTQLPDYSTFCLDCHGPADIGARGSINWNGDPHGKMTAGPPHGSHNGHAAYGDAHPCPDWDACGRASSWDGDNCAADDGGGSDLACWPVTSRSVGDTLMSRGPYDHRERITGINFVMTCIDCHEAHGSNRDAFIRERLNTTNNGDCGTGGDPATQGENCTDGAPWNSFCNICHFYYSPQHATMSCANASCHDSPRPVRTWMEGSDSPHGIAKGGSGGSRTLRSDEGQLVVYYQFENNLNDTADWRLHGGWRVTSGSFAPGKVGNAVEVNDDPIEVATTDATWSTCEGGNCGLAHPPNQGGGGWKYTEMKYNMTLETWVYPTADTGTERRIIAKHTYWTGGYTLELRKIDGTWRAALLTNINGGDDPWRGSDCNGLRGAFSTVSIPLNEWTHIAATYDYTGPDRDPGDGSVGRIRIYVNGEDVTTSYPNVNQCYTQPGPGEDTMFPHSDWNDIDPGKMCFNGTWCASALSVGGLNWSAPDDNFIGRLDEVKVWNITKDAAYFDAQVPPAITKVEGIAGYDRLYVEFPEGVYAGTDGTGNLQPSDFTLNSDAKTIVSVIHAAGTSTATLILSSPLNESGDIDVDTLAAAVNAIYDEYGSQPALTNAVVITALPTTVIEKVEGFNGGNKLKVTFTHWVFANPDATGALNTADLTLTDVNGDNPRTIAAVQHNAGESSAIITMDAPLISADITVDTVAAAGGSIFNSAGYPIGTTPVTITAQAAPAIVGVEGLIGSDQIVVYFSEGVYTEPGQLGALQVSDFVLSDIDNLRSVISVIHTAGAAAAILTLSSALDNSNDIGVDTLAAAGNNVYNRLDNPMGTTAVTITGNNCPVAGTRFDFNETTGSVTVTDASGLLIGQVGNPGFSMLGDGLYSGDPTEAALTYIDVDNTDVCLKSPRALTLESRFFMGNVDLDYVDVSPANGIDDDYDAGGPFSQDGDGRNTTQNRIAERLETFQFTIMRGNWAGDEVAARAGKARVMFKYRVTDRGYCDGSYPGDPTVGNGAWMKQISSDIENYPLVKDHWYQVKIVFNTDNPRLAVDIFADDQGTDGSDAGELWPGYKNITLLDPEESAGCKWAAIPGLEMSTENKYLYIGDNSTHQRPGNDDQGHFNNTTLKGALDWFIWKPVADYGPFANAGPDQNVTTFSTVTLDGSASSAHNGQPLSYGWTQTGGAPVTLSSNTISRPTFTAPGSADMLTFSLVVTDSQGLASTPDTVVVNVGSGFVSAMSGNWSDPATWGSSMAAMSGPQNNSVPGLNDFVTIKAGTVVTIDSNAQSYRISIEPDATLVILPNNTLTVEDTLLNNGVLRQTLTSVPNGSTTEFLHIKNPTGTATKYYGVDIRPTSGDMGLTAVSIYGNRLCPNSPSSAIRRCWEITPKMPQTATVTFYYRDTEENEQDNADMWHWNDSAFLWHLQIFDSRDRSRVEDNWIKVSGVDTYSPFSGFNSTAAAIEGNIYLPIILKDAGHKSKP